MITLEKPAASSAKVFAIREASYVDPYQLRLTFTDGQKSLVDFEPFLRGSRHPAIQAYLDQRKFRAFTVEDGFLHWNDFELVFPMADLHAGRIS